ncbi:unnamed protein product [uncultured virus]|nr:unnamed protein product [uncultured virus]
MYVGKITVRISKIPTTCYNSNYNIYDKMEKFIFIDILRI